MTGKTSFTEAFCGSATALGRARKGYWDRGCPGLMMYSYRSGRRTFFTYYRGPGDGKPKFYKLGQHPGLTAKAAREAARRVLGEVAMGRDPHAEHIEARRKAREAGPDDDPDVRWLITDYVEKMSRTKKSWRQYEEALRKYVEPRLGRRLVRDVRRRDVMAMFDELNAAGKPTLANQVVRFTSAMFTHALEREHVEANPCRRIKPNKLASRDRALEGGEVAAFWRACHAAGEEGGAILKLILVTAQRPGEVTFMRWGDLDRGRAEWSMPGEPVGGWRGTKNGHNHGVPLSDLAVDLLDGRAGGDWPTEGRVFTLSRPPSAAPVCRAAGMKACRAHDLRHTAATEMSGHPNVTLEDVSHVLNHLVGSAITRRYTKGQKFKPQKRAALVWWARRLQSLLGGEGGAEVVVEFAGAARNA